MSVTSEQECAALQVKFMRSMGLASKAPNCWRKYVVHMWVGRTCGSCIAGSVGPGPQ